MSLRDQIEDLIGDGNLSGAHLLLYDLWIDGKLIPDDEYRQNLEAAHENATRRDSSEDMQIIREAAVLLKADTSRPAASTSGRAHKRGPDG